MKIAASQMQLDSASARSQRLDVSERLDTWDGPARRNDNDGPSRPQVSISQQGMAAQQADAVTSEEAQNTIEPRLQILMQFIERLTGRAIKVYLGNDVQPTADNAATTGAAAAGNSNGTTAPQGGPGFSYEYHRRYEESEAVAFQAQGSVLTADGRRIDFAVNFEMSRQFVDETHVSVQGGSPRLKDPLVIDFAGSPQELGDTSFRFDLDADGSAEDVPLLAGGRGFLAFDRNNNGTIDDGSELFGPQSGDGFADLAALDSDRNGWIDENDAAWSQLRVWQPGADGKGKPMTLAQADVGAIGVANVDTGFDIKTADNTQLGRMRASGVYLRESGGAGTVSQVDLSV